MSETVKRPWLKGRLKEPFLNLRANAPVWYRPTRTAYLNYGECWWVLSKTQLHLVTRTFGGTALGGMIRPELKGRVQITTKDDYPGHLHLCNLAKKRLNDVPARR